MSNGSSSAKPSRFDVPSSPIRLGRFRRDVWGRQAVTLGLSILAHLLVTMVPMQQSAPRTHTVQKPAPKSLTTRFIQRKARMLTPFEVKRIPAPKPRELKRAMELITIRAPVGWGSVSLKWAIDKFPQGFKEATIGALDAGLSSISSMEPIVVSSPLGAITMYPYATWGSPIVWRAELDLLKVDNLDFGRYHALIIQNPDDKREIEGFYHLAQVHVRSIMLADGRGPHPQSRGLARLVQAVSDYTGIRCDLMEESYALDDPEVQRVPLIYLVAYGLFNLQPNETHILGRYVMGGGLVFAEDGRQDVRGGPGWRSLRNMLEEALSSEGYRRGRDWTFKRLSASHPLYHAFFDFDGPPVGDDVIEGDRVIPYLEGVTLGDRLVAIVSQKEIGKVWSNFEAMGIDPTRQLQFGVNLVVFALTQPGSVTDRAMGTVMGVE